MVEVTFNDKNLIIYGLNARYNDAFAGQISRSPLTPHCRLRWWIRRYRRSELDHVFMVYMENSGYSDIVGSKNAPYLNSLIEQYGFADNYFGADPWQPAELLPDRRRLEPWDHLHRASPCIYTTNLSPPTR